MSMSVEENEQAGNAPMTTPINGGFSARGELTSPYTGGKKLITIIGGLLIIIILVGAVILFGGKDKAPVKTTTPDFGATPKERREAVIERVKVAEAEPLTDQEAQYIFEWVFSSEGRSL